MAQASAELTARGARVLIVGPGTPAKAAWYRERNGLPFPVLADPDGATARYFGVGRWLLSLARQSALIIIAPDGTVAETHVVDLPTGIPTPADLVAAIDRVAAM